jgi:hypothetical protein
VTGSNLGRFDCASDDYLYHREWALILELNSNVSTELRLRLAELTIRSRDDCDLDEDGRLD